MLVVPPDEIYELVDVDSHGDFILTGEPTEEQKRIFEQFLKDFDEMEAETLKEGK